MVAQSHCYNYTKYLLYPFSLYILVYGKTDATSHRQAVQTEAVHYSNVTAVT